MTTTLLICVGGHMVMTGIYNYRFLLPFCIPFVFRSTLAVHGSLAAGVNKTFTFEGSRTLLFLPGLSCSFPLALIMGTVTLRNTLKDLL